MTDRIRVAVNLTWLDPGRVGGSEEYLTRQLAGVDRTVVEPTLYCSPAFARAHPELAASFGVRPAPGGTSRPARLAIEHTWLARATRDADVVHHGGGTAPVVGRRPIVLTVHDLQFLVHPEFFSTTRRRYLEVMVPRSIARAAVVAVPSGTVRDHVLEAYGVVGDRVVVVPHGVPEPADLDADDVDRVRHDHGLGSDPYVVYPAITHPHKGHAVLLDMICHLDDGTRLVLIGGAGAAERDLQGAIRSSGQADRIVRPGRVPVADRDALLAGADALVFPSRFEGFGAPLVEAMAVGTPVVCSGAAAVREVVGDAAVVVDEADGSAWAAGVTAARRRTAELVAAGHRRRVAFTIDRSGAAITAAYRQALGR